MILNYTTDHSLLLYYGLPQSQGLRLLQPESKVPIRIELRNLMATSHHAHPAAQKQTEPYLTLLREAGYRITEQREKICRYLATTDRHPTAYEVYADLQAIDPDISRATVYNTLNTLQQLGAIVEINFGASQTHYETDTAPHINLICLRCHAIEDCPCELLPRGLLQKTVDPHGFRAVATKVDVVGICKACQQAEASS